jgi:hypothetical protein
MATKTGEGEKDVCACKEEREARRSGRNGKARRREIGRSVGKVGSFHVKQKRDGRIRKRVGRHVWCSSRGLNGRRERKVGNFAKGRCVVPSEKAQNT